MPCDERERSCRERGYRFDSFEEADARMMRTMARAHASLRSKTSAESIALNEAEPHYILIGFRRHCTWRCANDKDIDLLVATPLPRTSHE